MDEEPKTVDEIFHKMSLLCSKAEQSSPEIIRKMKELGCTDEMTQEIIGRLEKENFLNDQRFVRMYIHEKFSINKWGKIKIHYYLKMKGLKEEIIHAGLEEIDENEYIELLLRTMKEKAAGVRAANKYEKMGQIIRFVQSRGFEPELIHRYLNHVIP
jgi:regulatory protein